MFPFVHGGYMLQALKLQKHCNDTMHPIKVNNQTGNHIALKHKMYLIFCVRVNACQMIEVVKTSCPKPQFEGKST